MNGDKQHHAAGQVPDRRPLEITHLKRREIQAPIAACLIREFARVMGHDQAVEIATAAIQADALGAGRQMAERYGGNSMAELGRILREVWAVDEAMTFHILEETAGKLSFDVTRCRYVELYEKLGMKELGFCLSCSRDETFIQSFNPCLKLYRTQTIMQGASFCDFRFVLK